MVENSLERFVFNMLPQPADGSVWSWEIEKLYTDKKQVVYLKFGDILILEINLFKILLW